MSAQWTSPSVKETANPNCHPGASSFCFTHIKSVSRLNFYFQIHSQLIIPPTLSSSRPQFQLRLCHQHYYISCNCCCNNIDNEIGQIKNSLIQTKDLHRIILSLWACISTYRLTSEQATVQSTGQTGAAVQETRAAENCSAWLQAQDKKKGVGKRECLEREARIWLNKRRSQIYCWRGQSPTGHRQNVHEAHKLFYLFSFLFSFFQF